MKVVLTEANTIVIELPFDAIGRPSASGKSKVHASTNGNKPTNVEVGGKPLIIGVNVYTQR